MIQSYANEICAFLKCLPEVRSCKLYGSVSRGSFDGYSDIDIEIDVSGVDNGEFAMELPRILVEKYPVVFSDFAPSLAPDKYVLSVAMNEKNPFMVVDICCAAVPHCSTVTRQELAARNNRYDHTLKLFVANLKHFLREADCYSDILKMYSRIFGSNGEVHDEGDMLRTVCCWLQENAQPRHERYVSLLEDYL